MARGRDRERERPLLLSDAPVRNERTRKCTLECCSSGVEKEARPLPITHSAQNVFYVRVGGGGRLAVVQWTA